MASTTQHRLLTIQQAIVQRPDAMVTASIDLWERLASVLILTIGADSFQMLFSRCVHATGRIFPWMIRDHAGHAAEYRFAVLRSCLEEQAVAESSVASASLLNAFIDMLILLLGEKLASNVLSSAWNSVFNAHSGGASIPTDECLNTAT
jgi:hypothetical protein